MGAVTKGDRYSSMGDCDGLDATLEEFDVNNVYGKRALAHMIDDIRTGQPPPERQAAVYEAPKVKPIWDEADRLGDRLGFVHVRTRTRTRTQEVQSRDVLVKFLRTQFSEVRTQFSFLRTQFSEVRTQFSRESAYAVGHKRRRFPRTRLRQHPLCRAEAGSDRPAVADDSTCDRWKRERIRRRHMRTRTQAERQAAAIAPKIG